jgi:hypothetical protein
MFDELKHLAAHHLAKRPRGERVDLQTALDQWNADAAAWTKLSCQRPLKALKRQFTGPDLRRSMEWALA